MGTSRDLGIQTGSHVLNFGRIKKYTLSKNSSFCSLKLLVMILLRGISCYHLPEVLTKGRV